VDGNTRNTYNGKEVTQYGTEMLVTCKTCYCEDDEAEDGEKNHGILWNLGLRACI